MKTYRSHKTVQAAKITHASRRQPDKSDPFDGYRLQIGSGALDFADVDLEWVARHAPFRDASNLIGGYFVSYRDGYTSWSPAAAFEEGYTEASLGEILSGLPVSGYRPQTQANLDTVNMNKQIEEATLRILDSLESYPGIERRWLAIGRTHIEQGWMAINRAIFKPERAVMPDDTAP